LRALAAGHNCRRRRLDFASVGTVNDAISKRGLSDAGIARIQSEYMGRPDLTNRRENYRLSVRIQILEKH
jgi:hypothetical protein